MTSGSALQRLFLNNFRGYERAEVAHFEPQTVLFGTNGIGKTSVLEATAILSSLKSFKTHKLSETVQSDAEAATIRAISANGTEISVKVEGGHRSVTQDGKPVRTAAEYSPGFWSVALAPEHEALLHPTGEERRKYLDRILFARDAGYLDVAQRYARALRQKRALFRKPLPFPTYLDLVGPWNAELAACGEQIRKRRRNLLDGLSPEILSRHQELSGGLETLEVFYEGANVPLVEEMEGVGRREYDARRALAGPHRDDLKLELRGSPVAEVASHGERGTLLLALKWAEYGYLRKSRTDRAVILLDDLGATLDAGRRDRLLEILGTEDADAILTTADDGVLRAAMEKGARAFVKKIAKNSDGKSIAQWVPA